MSGKNFFLVSTVLVRPKTTGAPNMSTIRKATTITLTLIKSAEFPSGQVKVADGDIETTWSVDLDDRNNIKEVAVAGVTQALETILDQHLWHLRMDPHDKAFEP
jgi:hypothetical protein